MDGRSFTPAVERESRHAKTCPTLACGISSWTRRPMHSIRHRHAEGLGESPPEPPDRPFAVRSKVPSRSEIMHRLENRLSACPPQLLECKRQRKPSVPGADLVVK